VSHRIAVELGLKKPVHGQRNAVPTEENHRLSKRTK
jgi:hypothetical protein